jgi:mono/diheme cytochrome c family protein
MRHPSDLTACFVTLRLACILLSVCGPAQVLGEDAISYARDIRPILADKCFACHGPDEAARKAKLRLDTREDAHALKDGHAAIVPGKPEDSELVFRIESDDAETQMPPPKSGKSLNAKQVALLRRWVEQGGDFASHWAFEPPVQSALPVVRNEAWVRTPIDNFVLANLERRALEASPEAGRVTLIRRLSLDLIGLPPTPLEVDEFMADTSDEAYNRLVERLLASPHYGERWGRLWLDAARYADSDGYEKDKPRFVWHYRDWVINALNRDLPYNQFVEEQLAGDLLPGATQDQRVATGFLRNSMINEEGGIDPEQFRMEAMFDRMDAVGTAVLGLTLKCAQCHNHKYDPITQKEYYQMFAYINNCHEANIAVYTPQEQLLRDEILRKTSEIEARLRREHPDWQSLQAAWEASVLRTETVWKVVTPAADDDSTGGQKYLPQADGSFLAQGYAPTKHTVNMSVRVDQPRITAFQLELLTDPDLPRGGPGRSIKGTAALTEFIVDAAPVGAPDQTRRVTFQCATADVNPPEAVLDPIFDDKSGKKRVTGPVGYAIDGNPDTAWGIDVGPGLRNQARKAVFVAAEPIENLEGTILTFRLAQNHGGWNSDDNQNCNLGRFRLSVSAEPHPSADLLPSEVRGIIESVPAAQRDDRQSSAVFGSFRTSVVAWKAANKEIDELWAKHPEGTTQLVLEERRLPRSTHLLVRGDFLNPGEAIEPGVPAFLQASSREVPATRLEFARWLTTAPTTARTLVNRVWQAYFGTGLVESSEDLGTQGSTPSDPELLDWLSVEFMNKGGSLKELHRLIVRSSAYRQSSYAKPELLAADPENRWLARGPRLRIEAELLRDSALFASGLLDTEIGGPSVQPPAPAFLFVPPASYGPKVWEEAKGAERYRRALYTFRFRSVPYPALQTFDAPNGDIACVRRSRSNTPLQALTTLNEPLFMECARALALRVLNTGDATDAERVNLAFRCCVARLPSEGERHTLLELLARQTRHFEEAGKNPWELAANDPAVPPPLPAGVRPAEAAAWTALARVLLNLDESITKE